MRSPVGQYVPAMKAAGQPQAVLLWIDTTLKSRRPGRDYVVQSMSFPVVRKSAIRPVGRGRSVKMARMGAVRGEA